MLSVLLNSDAHDRRGNIALGKIASAIANANNRIPNRFAAERNAWAEIRAGIVSGKLHPIDPDTNASLGGDNYGPGGVQFDQLKAWGHAAGYDFRIVTKKNTRLENAVLPTSGGGSSWRHEVHRNAAVTPEWVYWPAERRVDSWQAVSLSLGLDPDSLEHAGECITAASFPTAEVQAEFEKRLALVSALTSYVCAPLLQFVALLERFPMPPELAVLAAPAAPDKPPSSTAHLETRPETDDESQKVDAAIVSAGATATGEKYDKQLPWWQADYDILLLARNAGDSLRRKRERTSNRKIGDAVANRIEADEQRGKKRKPPSGEHIKNTVLKGWKYQPDQAE